MAATQGKWDEGEEQKAAGKAFSRKALELQKPGKHVALEPSCVAELQTERAWPAMRQKASEVHLPESAVLNPTNQAILQLLRRDVLFLFHRARC